MKLPNKNNHSRSLSITKKLLFYLSVFTVLLFLVIYVVLTVFLEPFYQGIKRAELNEAKKEITASLDGGSLQDKIAYLSNKNQMCIGVYDGLYRSVVITDNLCYSGNVGNACFIHERPAPSQAAFLTMVKNEYGGTYEGRYEGKEKDNPFAGVRTQTQDAVFLSVDTVVTDSENTYYIVIETKLTPMQTAVKTIGLLLLIIAAFFVVLACLMAFLLSRKISQPLVSITKSASDLAKGDFSMTFRGQGYLEVEELTESLNFASSELQKTESLRRELIANVSHDLRTPLTMIRGYAEMMRDIPGETTPENMQIIIDESSRLTALVTDILDLSKLQSGNVPILRQTFCLSDLAEDTAKRIGRMTQFNGVNITAQIDPDAFISGDPTRIEQVLYNLIGNAVNYGGETPEVQLRLIRKDRKITVEVRDNGLGIPLDLSDKIWQRYYRNPSSNEKSGTGLGLAISHDILVLHNAQFGVKNETDDGKHGSCFWFSFPEAQEPDDDTKIK